jgi:hypothetical protein
MSAKLATRPLLGAHFNRGNGRVILRRDELEQELALRIGLEARDLFHQRATIPNFGKDV